MGCETVGRAAVGRWRTFTHGIAVWNHMSSEWPWRTRSVSCQRQPQNFGFRDVATQHDGCVRLGGRWVCTGSVQNVPIRRSLNPS